MKIIQVQEFKRNFVQKSKINFRILCEMGPKIRVILRTNIREFVEMRHSPDIETLFVPGSDGQDSLFCLALAPFLYYWSVSVSSVCLSFQKEDRTGFKQSKRLGFLLPEVVDRKNKSKGWL